MTHHYLACDLGAESGRLMLGSLVGDKLTLSEIHRFRNTPLQSAGSIHWDIPYLFAELKLGLTEAASLRLPIASLSCDSWGVDYLLFAEAGTLISPSYHYRDPRSERGVRVALSKADWHTIFAETGIQFMALNTLFQLAAEDPQRLADAAYLLGVGDGFNFMLSGRACVDQSMASTFQLYNPRTGGWSDTLISALGFPRGLFPQIVPSGTRLGPLDSHIAAETGLERCEVIASCSHDTGAAVVSVPASSESWAYLSSGTWSLMGVELAEPIISDQCRELNFTNEVGYGGSIRLLKNIVGLWIVQECRRDWELQGKSLDYPRLMQMAAEAPSFTSLIDPTDPRFLSPGGMPEKIAAFCRETRQLVPEDHGAIIRCVLESLALLYRRTLEQLEDLLARRVQYLHIVGGGSKNSLLNRFTANAIQIPVLAGPSEATAIGNVLVQAITMGQIPSLGAARVAVCKSFPPNRIEPQEEQPWGTAYQTFTDLQNRS
jgi:rhamnulokinase